ncbi:MAG TPA: (deoxy)nucleoside triphosphate pyrophosphohydrolase [Gemmatales bacterium]|nr:(deoxy)nucleoside triphosphate pyrophosphohydrolase [Gemmatales bacterium]
MSTEPPSTPARSFIPEFAAERTTIVVGIVVHGERVLVGVRPEGCPLAGCAEFPGGKVLPGEALEAALAREVMEETGLAVRPSVWRQVVEHDYAHGRLQLHFIRCELVGTGSPRPPFRWASWSELARLPFPAANAEVIQALLVEQERLQGPDGGHEVKSRSS